ncbi:DUF4269 domain-containing protein [Tunicatimonas pelagia]|uniref:DUF4269 domain-containing protein n=1 Tax=Tunicatimonas pelagia TaxID=931531 RepID=UPI0026658599|nr:DUF4269 domain-containing protein [Tunicatimonas pelagia]WKN41887.1 DUF4269 domain-containing protein [Tunicatimonas pelagia]
MKFASLSYLGEGNDRQQSAYRTLQGLGLFNYLSAYCPVLTGTVPLGIDVDTSDLDICCEAHDRPSFIDFVSSRYGHLTGFCVDSNSAPQFSTIIRFSYQKWLIELFGQSLPAIRQHAYRHMMVEHRILQLADANFHRKVRELKQRGVKTEPAFAQLLNLLGDPYQAVLDLENYADGQLRQLLAKGG